ncbi:hypothetical protein RN001_016468 [Aquatica leii]|uniref:Retrotransposon gag domain-containing protein n=1 Tax=Aquatica leii TaxID=1421715 RepID=A0AAN7NTG9_9COLE|nr:hypothetical protein RN001_016468 [Aquatica leii]
MPRSTFLNVWIPKSKGTFRFSKSYKSNMAQSRGMVSEVDGVERVESEPIMQRFDYKQLPNPEITTQACAGNIFPTGYDSTAIMLSKMDRMLRIIENQQDQPKQQLTPIFNNMIRDFNGEVHHVEAVDWLEQLKSSASINNWSDQWLLETARLHLTGAARSWYATRRVNIHNFGDFERAFRRTFVDVFSTTEKWEKMRKGYKLSTNQ